MDADITQDSDGDGTPDNDKDILCNQAKLFAYTPTSKSTVARIFYTEADKEQTKDVTVEFVDYELLLTESQQEHYDNITDIVAKLQGNTDKDVSFLVTLLLTARANLNDEVELASVITQIRDLIETIQ